MSTFTKVVVSLLALYVAVQTFAGGLFPSEQKLPSQLGYLEALAQENDRKIVICLTGKEWNGPCKSLDTEVIGTWEWCKFSRNEIIFENFDYPPEGQTGSTEMRQLRKQFADTGFPTFIVATAEGEILGWKTGYDLNGPIPLENWIRSL